MPTLRIPALVSFVLLVAGFVYLVTSVNQLPMRQHPHNLAYDTEETIDQLMRARPYKGRNYYSGSADIYNKAVLSKLMHLGTTDIDSEQASWAKLQIDKHEAESVAAWREQRDRERQLEMARLGQEGGQVNFQAFDPFAKNPVKNPLQGHVG